MEKSIAQSQKISYLIIKYGTLALILEEGCNSVFRTDKLIHKISILDYFIENIICILKNKDVEYNSVKEFIDDFIFYINDKKRKPISHNKLKKTFGSSTTIEGFIQKYPSDEFNKYEGKFFIKIFPVLNDEYEKVFSEIFKPCYI
jgi:hypothetical protein